MLSKIESFEEIIADPLKPPSEQNEAAKAKRKEKKKNESELTNRRFHTAVQTRLSEFLKIKETLLALLMTYLPATSGSTRDFLPNDAPSESVVKQLKQWKQVEYPTGNPHPTQLADDNDFLGFFEGNILQSESF